MSFSEKTKNEAFRRSGGQCECRLSTHGHTGRCRNQITRHGAEYHLVTSQSAGGSDGLTNCEALCITCHKMTRSYGG